MSAGESAIICTPLCQGFLKKRKDTMKLRWVTYWFKLHNTTLFFYNKKHGSTSDLKGQYYLFEVESVQEIMRSSNKLYLFEITMKNGKRKVLAADTAHLREQWISQLLKAMKHIPNTTEPTSNWEVTADHMHRTQSSPCSSSSTEQNAVLIRRPHSIVPDSCQCTPNTQSDPVTPETTTHSSTAFVVGDTESSGFAEEEAEQKAEVIKTENDYDVLPPPKCLKFEEAIYDTPSSIIHRVSERRREMTESIYDVPKNVLRKASESVHEAPCAGDTAEIAGPLGNVMECLEGNTAEWGRMASSGAICQQ